MSLCYVIFHESNLHKCNFMHIFMSYTLHCVLYVTLCFITLHYEMLHLLRHFMLNCDTLCYATFISITFDYLK